MKKPVNRINSMSKSLFVAGFLLTMMSTFNGPAKCQTLNEKKVDYLERIYFSGQNKEGLNLEILKTIQKIQQDSPTSALAKQITFLLDIQDDAEAAKSACDILDLFAVGIYSIDATEAELQGVKMPSEKAKGQAAGAVTNLNKLTSTSSSLSSAAGGAAWSSYLLSGGKYGKFASGAGRVANATGTIGTVAGVAGQGADAARKLSALVAGLKKDKPCSDIAKKDIRIREHLPNFPPSDTHSNLVAESKSRVEIKTDLPAASTTIINIQGINSTFLRAFTDTLRNKSGILSAERAYSQDVSTITISHNGATDVLVDWLEDNYKTTFKVIDYSPGKINISVKSTK